MEVEDVTGILLLIGVDQAVLNNVNKCACMCVRQLEQCGQDVCVCCGVLEHSVVRVCVNWDTMVRVCVGVSWNTVWSE